MTFARLLDLFNAALTQTVDVITPAMSTDAYGNVVADWGAGATHVAAKGLLQQAASTEYTTDRDTVVTEWELWLPVATVIVAKCRVVVDGRTFEVVGTPDVMRVPQGAHHIQARLVSIDG